VDNPPGPIGTPLAGPPQPSNPGLIKRVALFFGFLAFVVAVLILASQYSSQSSGRMETSSSASEETHSDDTAMQSKQMELAKAIAGPSATQMAGNVRKWKGSFVHFPCKITNVIDGPEANAMCGVGVTATFHNDPAPNIDYADGAAVAKAEKAAESSMAAQMKRAEDQAMIVLVGERVKNFDGGQIVTITGEVLGPEEGTNAMGATLNYPTVRVDYAE
jgi:hypothetical protein